MCICFRTKALFFLVALTSHTFCVLWSWSPAVCFWSIFSLCEDELYPITGAAYRWLWRNRLCVPCVPFSWPEQSIALGRTDSSRFPLGRARSVEQGRDSNKKEMQLLFFFPIKYLGYCISAWNRQHEALVIQIRGLLRPPPPLFSFLPPSNPLLYCLSSQDVLCR